MVETNVKYIGMTAEELIAQWDESRDFGTLVHNNIESYINNQTYKDISEVRHAIKWMKKFKNLSEFIFYPEVIIYSTELGIAGSIDVLAKDTKNDTHIIIDWKTSKTINKSSFGGRMGIHPITSHLMDCKYVHYSMQLSLYRYLIEEFYGIKISNLLIAHLNGNECKPIIADYYKKEVIDNINIIRLPLYPSHSSSIIGRILNSLSVCVSSLIYTIFFMPKVDVIYGYHPPLTIGIVLSLACAARE